MCDRDCFNCKYDDCICEEVTADDLAGLKKAEIVAGLRAEEPAEYEEIRRKKNEYQKAYYHRHKEQYKKYKADILREIRWWKTVKENGCNDPFWPDGTNMNLIRNHIIFAKKSLLEVCIENNIPVPEEYYMPTPPRVDDDYMASLKQKERVKRLREMNKQLKMDKPSYLENQMSLL